MTSDPNNRHDPGFEERLIRIESVLAHLQQDIESLNASLLSHLQQIRAFEGRCQRLEAAVQQIAEPAEQRDPEQEQPPHY